MTIEEFKIRLKNNDDIIYYSTNDDLLRKLEKTLFSYGWKWCSQHYDLIPLSLIDNYLSERHGNVFYMYSTVNKKLSYNIKYNFDMEFYSKIELTEEVIKTIEFIFNPIPTYKPKTFDKNI